MYDLDKTFHVHMNKTFDEYSISTFHIYEPLVKLFI